MIQIARLEEVFTPKSIISDQNLSVEKKRNERGILVFVWNSRRSISKKISPVFSLQDNAVM